MSVSCQAFAVCQRMVYHRPRCKEGISQTTVQGRPSPRAGRGRGAAGGALVMAARRGPEGERGRSHVGGWVPISEGRSRAATTEEGGLRGPYHKRALLWQRALAGAGPREQSRGDQRRAHGVHSPALSVGVWPEGASAGSSTHRR